ncbi:Rrp46p [Lachancea thermotolerans]|uniref:KLTH0F11924p n=1 Tax=Lachancea thermotolerans (strain ATCC 56472 / CBS 6340 / NRRL Y-8284) TaxID=559295 RepID=C5DLC8_LACTC|nr:KLTH0F11924p [Lachancea thermotolerans CBS 6340]CAR24279.1 KLTH0F11924p [Lachancea thermotolerans CBS 6340]
MISAQTGVLDQVDGSCKLQCGETTVICSVTGPIEPKARQELPSQLALEVVVRPCKGVPNTREKLLEDQIRGVVTPVLAKYLYPRQLCQICFQILESGEPEDEYNVKELNSCINAAYLALIDSGVALQSSFSSVCVSVLGSNNEILVNPTQEQLIKSDSTHILALEVGSGGKKIQNVLLIESNGDFTEEIMFNVLSRAEKACVEVALELRKAVEDKIKRDFIWKQ